MEHQTLSSIGTISKKENLASVVHNTFSTALVLESLFLFPGYNGTTVPDRTDPRALFLVTKTVYDDDKIIRAIRIIKETFSNFFDGAPGRITLFNEPAGVIRIKHLTYEQVGDLVEAFEKQGVEFMKEKKIAEYSSIIHITKYFQIEHLEQGIYADKNWKNMFYIEIPIKLKWSSFEKITTDITHNVEDKTFDAALTTMYDPLGILDMVRIYDEQFTAAKLQFIRNKYHEAIKYM